MPTEIELKLALAPEDIPRLLRHRLLKGGARSTTRHLHSVYYDTPRWELWERGTTLRVRRDGARWLQTVKGGGRVEGGLHQRIESEAELGGPLPEFNRIRAPEFSRLFGAARLRVQLKPAFVTEFDRVIRSISPAPGVVIEACADRGEIKSGDRTEPLAELELELKSGPPWRLYQFALRLLEVAPLRVENRSKAERGHALALGAAARPVKAASSMVRAEMTVNDAFKAVAWACLDQLQRNEHGVLRGEDPEYLHQMRVALRRLRSAFTVFGPVLPASLAVTPRAELKWLARALGPARDWDVFATQALPPVCAQFPDHSGLAEFRSCCERLRRTANRRAREAVNSLRYQRLMLSLGGWLSAETWLGEMNAAQVAAFTSPVTGFASSVLARRYTQVRKRGRRLGALSAQELHALRIAVKKLHYAVQFFAPLYQEKPVRQVRAGLAGVQDALGALNDAATTERLIEAVSRAGQRSRAGGAAGILRGWNASARATHKRELAASWKEFRECEVFW